MAVSSEVVAQVKSKTYSAPTSMGDPFEYPPTNAVAEVKA
jgi:hypothetical protein